MHGHKTLGGGANKKRITRNIENCRMDFGIEFLTKTQKIDFR